MCGELVTNMHGPYTPREQEKCTNIHFRKNCRCSLEDGRWWSIACAMTYFLPSRDLPSLGYGVSQDAIYTGVVRIAHALGVAEGQVEDVYVVLDGQHLPDEDGEEHQDDTFEKDTVVRWLMGVSSLKWIHDHLQDHNQIIEDIVQRASHLLTICAGQMGE